MVKLLVRTDSVVEPGQTSLVIVTDRDQEGREIKSLIFVITRRENEVVTAAVYEADTVDEFMEFASREGSGIELPPGEPVEPDELSVDEMFREGDVIDF